MRAPGPNRSRIAASYRMAPSPMKIGAMSARALSHSSSVASGASADGPVSEASAARAVERREHFAALRVDPRRHGRRAVGAGDGQRVERRDRHDPAAGRHRQALHRGDADPQPGERTGAGGHGQQVDSLERNRRCCEDPHEVLRQPFAVVCATGRRRSRRRARRRLTTATLPARVVVSSARTNTCRLNVILAPTGSPPVLQPATRARCPPLSSQSLPGRPRRCGSTSTPSGSTATPSSSSGWATSTRCSTRTRSSAARALELTLTSRSKDASGGAIPMCGVPFHAADGYIARLVTQGLSRRHLRAGRGSEEGQGPRASARSCASCRRARSPTPAISRRASRRS